MGWCCIRMSQGLRYDEMNRRFEGALGEGRIAGRNCIGLWLRSHDTPYARQCCMYGAYLTYQLAKMARTVFTARPIPCVRQRAHAVTDMLRESCSAS